MKTRTVVAALMGGTILVICGCAEIQTMTTNDSIRGRATAESNRKWREFLRISGPAIYKYRDGAVYKTADNKLTYQAQDVPDTSGERYSRQEGSEVPSGSHPKYDSGMSSYTDSESNGHTVTWDTDLDGNKVYHDSVTSPIIGGRYDTDQDTTRTYITAP